MTGVALKGLLGRKLRAILTAFAIVLGVAMISGAFVLTDTLGKGFDGIYDESYASADAVISSKIATSTDDGGEEAPAFSALPPNSPAGCSTSASPSSMRRPCARRWRWRE